MAAGAWGVFGLAKEGILEGTFGDFRTAHGFRMILTTSTQDLTAGLNTLDTYSDLTNEVANGGGYTTGGVSLGTCTVVHAAGTVTFDDDGTDVSWAASTITARYAVIARRAAGTDTALAGTDLLLCRCILDTTGGGEGTNVSTTNGTFAVNFHANGILTLA